MNFTCKESDADGDATSVRERQRGLREKRCRARRCESGRVGVPMGLCKRHGSVSDPRAVPEERSPEGSSASEESEDTAEGSDSEGSEGTVGSRSEEGSAMKKSSRKPSRRTSAKDRPDNA